MRETLSEQGTWTDESCKSWWQSNIEIAKDMGLQSPELEVEVAAAAPAEVVDYLVRCGIIPAKVEDSNVVPLHRHKESLITPVPGETDDNTDS